MGYSEDNMQRYAYRRVDSVRESCAPESASSSFHLPTR